MAKKIYLSPSNQTANKYAYGNTNEAVQCRRIADALEIALKRCGFEVKNNQKDAMKDRVAESNAWKADLHLPIHTNAYNKKTTGARLFSYNATGEGRKACRAIFEFLAPITPGINESISSYPSLYEIKYSSAPCAYLECEFHDNAESAKWIVENVEEIAEAICKGICKYFGVTYKKPVVVVKDEPKKPEANSVSPNTSTVKITLPVVKRGSKGDAARTVMVLLRDKGYYKSALDADDKTLGPVADTAIRAFQNANKLEADGIVGAATWAALLD